MTKIKKSLSSRLRRSLINKERHQINLWEEILFKTTISLIKEDKIA